MALPPPPPHTSVSKVLTARLEQRPPGVLGLRPAGFPPPREPPRVTRRGSLGLCPPPAGWKTGCSQCTLFRADNLHDQSDPRFHTDVPSSTRSWVLGSLSFQCRWGSILETAGRSFWKEPSGSSPSGGRAGTRAVRGDGVSRLPADRDPREPELGPEPRPGSPQR